MNDARNQPVAVTDSNFDDEVLKSEQPVLVDFWAEWCAPCRALGPVIDSLSDDFAGRARIAKVDVDANQAIAARYGIRSIPTVMLFHKGQLVDTFVGVRPKGDYSAALEKTALA
ncbi:MAG TPA: thioredoxin [Woeseiaceae bacterium]|nr:thioredoxin [Woeseiaceae bacterium]